MKFSLLFLLLLFSCQESDSSLSSETLLGNLNPDLDNDANTVELMTLINNHRIDLGLNPLTLVSGLNTIVQNHSQNMANGSVAFGHSGFSGRCSSSYGVLGGGNLCAENVALGQKNAQAAFDAWMNSSGHRANIEKARVTHTGFGYAKSSVGTYYWTQIFIEKN